MDNHGLESLNHLNVYPIDEIEDLLLHHNNNNNSEEEDEGTANGNSSNNSIADADSTSDSQKNETDLSTSEAEIGYFEGPEKTMEVVFRSDKGAVDGLRSLSRNNLDYLCTKAKCSIISKVSNNHMDAYVLSESSLFVYRHRFIMKTCGTTTLLRCLSSLLEFADVIGLELLWVGYSRKNLSNPSAQLWPHSNFGEEIRYIDSHEKFQNRLKGTGHILGPITGDHWFVYVADHSQYNDNKCCLAPHPEIGPFVGGHLTQSAFTPSNERTINMMMFDLDPEVAALFFTKTCPTGKQMTTKAGIQHLCPGAAIDETCFHPCGYSMNAILHDAYSTIHVTPQTQCSYASFETNNYLSNYSALVRNVLTIFRPKRFVLTLFGDQCAIDELAALPTDRKLIPLPGLGDYRRSSVSSTQVNNDLSCLMACYSLDCSLPPPPHLIRSQSVGTHIDEECDMNVSTQLQQQQQHQLQQRERGHSLC